MTDFQSRIFTSWGREKTPESPYEEKSNTSNVQRDQHQRPTHHRRSSSSLARWFSNLGKSSNANLNAKSEESGANGADEQLILNYEDVDVARFTSDLLNDGYRYSTRTLLKAVEVPGAQDEEDDEGQGSPSSFAPTPRAGWEAPTAWSMSEGYVGSEDGGITGNGSHVTITRMSPVLVGDGHEHEQLERRASYKVLWDTLTNSSKKKESEKERAREGTSATSQKVGDKGGKKQKLPIEYVKVTVLSLKPHPEAFANSLQLRKHLLALGGDTRALAALMKDLNKHGASQRASLLFDMIRKDARNQKDIGAAGRKNEGSKDDNVGDLGHLADLYTYTTAISQCGTNFSYSQRGTLNKALEMFGEMKARGIGCNIHAYSALMGVCVKQNECHAAISVYKELEEDARVEPNLVTFNILIDAYNKLGMLQSSVEALEKIKRKRMLPEARTYNSIISACGKANKGAMAMDVYQMMLKDGVGPTNTTYTSAISACGRSGMVEEAMGLYRAMPSMGCQPNVITFSSLISVCERVGEMQLALTILDEMRGMGVAPNVVTYNGLLGCFAKAGAWQDALATVEEMQSKRIDLDAMSYSAVVTACSRAVPSKWREAIQFAEDANKRGLKLEAGAYTSLLGCLWSTGGFLMQKRALQMLQIPSSVVGSPAPRDNRGRRDVRPDSTNDNHAIKIRFNEAYESSMTSDSASACCLAMLLWVTGYRQDLRSASTYSKPLRVLLLTPGKYACVGSSKEDVAGALKAMIQAFSIPAQVTDTGRGRACAVKTDARHIATWMATPAAYLVKSLVGITDAPIKGGRGMSAMSWNSGSAGNVSSYMSILKDGTNLFAQCDRIMTNVNAFETAEAMFNGSPIPRRNLEAFEASSDLRRAIIQVIVNISGTLQLKETICHDSVQICNKLLAFGAADCLPPPPTCAVALLLIACRSNGAQSLILRNGQTLESSFSVSLDDVVVAETLIKSMLGAGITTISPIRVLTMYLDLLGYDLFNDAIRGNGLIGALVANATGLVSVAAVDASFAFTPPSIVAAACLSMAFRRSGMTPWPTLLRELTGIEEADERLVGTIAALQRLTL